MEENNTEIQEIEFSPIKVYVYVRLDENKVIKEINSSIFIQDLTNWIKIDEGVGDKYSQAQGNYIEKGLTDEKGRYNYKYDTKLVELTEEEKYILFPPQPPQYTEIETLKSDIDYLLILQEG